MANYTAADVQKAYIAFFGRPAEPAGLDFWVSVSSAITLEAMHANFAGQQEYRDYYAPFINASGVITNPVGMLNEVYQNLFDRDIEQTGIDFWAPYLVSGVVTIANVVTEVLKGAQGDDLVDVQNKLAASVAFTADARAYDYTGYNGAEAAADAHAWLAGVVDAASLAAHVAQPALHNAVVETIAPDVDPVTGSTFVLTPGLDTPQGGADRF